CAGFDAQVDQLAALIEAELSEPALVVGYSMGGRLALGLACRHPRLCARVIAVGASAGLETPEARAARRQQDARWARMLREEGLAPFLAAWQAQPLFATQARAPEAARAAQAALRASHAPEGLARCLERLGLGAMPPLFAPLGACDTPIEL